MQDFQWSDENVETLRRCVGANLTAAAISVVVKCSRNTVAGKCNRLGLRLMGGSREVVTAPELVEERTPTMFEVLPLVDPEPGSEPEPELPGLSIDDLASWHCRAIVCDAPTRYCAEPVTHSRFRFCSVHAAQFLVTSARMKAEARAARLSRLT